MSEHSILAPSSAHRWIECPASVMMAQRYPQEETEESREGEAAHWVVGEVYAGRIVAEGSIAPNGVVVTGEMIEGADMAVGFLRDDVRQEWAIEYRTEIGAIHPKCFGTADFYRCTSDTIDIADYKFGHRFVSEFDNWQMVSYAIGDIDDHRLDMNVRLTIIQPRCFDRRGSVRTWTTTARELLRDYLPRLQSAAIDALGPEPHYRIGDHCRDCPGRHACVPLQRDGYGSCDLALFTMPFDLPSDALGLELKMLMSAQTRLEARIGGLNEELLTRLKRDGVRNPYFNVEQGYGRRTWSKSVEEIAALGELYGVDLLKREAITPRQAVSAGIDESVINGYSTVPVGKIKLVPVDTDDLRRCFK